MIWLGGGRRTRTVEEYASQIDLAATLLARMGIDHSDFAYSKDIFDPSLPKFGYYVFNEGFGVTSAAGDVVWGPCDACGVRGADTTLLDAGRTLLQTTHVDLGLRENTHI